jgi:hypothetical protein
MSISNILSKNYNDYVIYANNRLANDVFGNINEYNYTGSTVMSTTNAILLTFPTTTNNCYAIRYMVNMYCSPSSANHPNDYFTQYSLSFIKNVGGGIFVSVRQNPNYSNTNIPGVTGQLVTTSGTNIVLSIQKDTGVGLNIWNISYYIQIIAT